MDRYPSILLSFVIAVVPIFTVALGDDVVMFSFSSLFLHCHIMSLMVVLLLNRDLYTYLVIRLIVTSYVNPSTWLCNSNDSRIFDDEKFVKRVCKDIPFVL